MNTEQKSKWEETKAKGKGAFIISRGIFRAGLLFAVLTAVGNYFFDYGLTFSKIAEYLLSGETIFKFLFGWLFFGLMYGQMAWHSNEREFMKIEKDKT